MKNQYDFCGWATKHNVLCADGRTIMRDAFKDCDGSTVPLVWGHKHDGPEYVLGHAVLENRDEGVFMYGYFNDSAPGQSAHTLVEHGDVTNMSIYANNLRQNGKNVMHGLIREVSLVLAGANPGAKITGVFAHSGMEAGEDEEFDECIIYGDDKIELYHADEDAKDDSEESKSDKSETDDDETVGDVIDSLSEKQNKIVKFLIAKAYEEGAKGANNNEENETDMKHNVFDTNDNPEQVISHEDMEAVIKDAKRFGSMKESALQHGIENIGMLFPEAKAMSDTPEFIQRNMEWVDDVLNGAHHTPFSRIKSLFADITEDDARALGYLPDRTRRDAKGNLVDATGKPAYKKEEVFSLLKRTTDPATVYKKQKMDRDDVIDITDFSVVAWIKSEMRMMLNEELARAILLGDGRLASSDDKINESNIRPIWKDEDLFTIKHEIDPSTFTASDFPDEVVMSMIDYKGSGNPTMFIERHLLTKIMVSRDQIGHRMYKTHTELAAACGVGKIVPVDVMTSANYTDDDGATHSPAAIIVNMKDYNVGADKGGEVTLFDDFDIDYNAQKYLIETRMSGALIKPYSAVAIDFVELMSN